jgi:hypothetical protein
LYMTLRVYADTFNRRNHMPGTPVTESDATKIYDILHGVCQAPKSNREGFVRWAQEKVPGDEFRFCGNLLGMTGKIWIKHDCWYVSGPNNDELAHMPHSDKIIRAVQKSTELLKELWDNTHVSA